MTSFHSKPSPSASTAYPSTPDPELLPAGRYIASIVKVREQEAKSGKGRHLTFTWQVMDGPHAGQRVWQTINYVHASLKAQAIGQAQLGQVAQACLIHHTIDTTDPLIGKPCRITVGVAHREPYPPQNTIRKVEQAASRGERIPPAGVQIAGRDEQSLSEEGEQMRSVYSLSRGAPSDLSPPPPD